MSEGMKLEVNSGVSEIGNILKKNMKHIKPEALQHEAIEYAINQAESLKSGLIRVKSFKTIYNSDIELSSDGEELDLSDVLRAAVVFTYALLEGFLRSIVLHLAEYASPDWLKEIPLEGEKKDKSLKLGHLALHRGKTVNELIENSLSSYILSGSLNFSNTNTISKFLNEFGIENTPVIKKLLPKIGEMIDRRHNIAHNADKQENSDQLTAISDNEVESWIDSTVTFMSQVLAYATIKKCKLDEEYSDQCDEALSEV